MKIVKADLTLKILAGGLAAAMLWFTGPADRLAAQSTPASGGGPGADQATMTIVKYLDGEVFEFEGRKMTVDEYQIKRGDSLVKILREQGVLTSTSRGEERKGVELLMRLNPGLKDPSAIVPGQPLKIPVPLDRPADAATGTQSQTASDGSTPSQPPLSATTVKAYEREAPSQQPAQVMTIVHGQSGAGSDEPAQEADPNLKRAASAEDPPTPEAEPTLPSVDAPVVAGTSGSTVGAGEPGRAPGPTASGPLDFPSGNPGTLAMEPASQVVYRTVKVQRGDSLERLLRREGMHRDLIYGHLLKVTLTLNPEIKNPDLILVGAEIKIPAAGDYLTTMAGVNPEEVRVAAKAVSERRRPDGGGAGRQSGRAAVLELPDEAALTAKNTLGLIFTRLGQKVDSRGTVLIPAGEAGMELDTAAFPVVELNNGGRLVLDPGSRLSSAAVRNLGKLKPPYQVFRTGKKETLERALGRLWSLCGYFRVYTKDRTYEGGGDIRLKISSDWMVWTTQEAWNSGQPMVINRAKSPELGTSPVWAAFLEAHGIKVLDIHRNQLLPAPETPPELPELPLVNLGDQHPTLLAAELVRQLGVEPRVGVQVDLARQPGQTVAPNLTAPVLWEDGSTRVVMEFGELPPEAIQTLRRNDYRVISSAREPEAVIDGVLGGFGLKARDRLVLNSPAGGPKISLSIKGKLVSRGDRSFLITQTPLPGGLGGLVEPNLKVLTY